MSNKHVTYKVVTHLAEVWILFALTMTLTSCSMNKRIAKCKELIVQVTDTITQTNTEIVTVENFVDVPYYIPADTSAWVKALIECDSLGKATIKSIEKNNGKRTTINTKLKDNVFTTTCDSDSLKGVIKALQTSTNKVSKELKTVVQPCPENKLSWWQKIKLNYGGYAIIAWIILILFFVGRKLLKQWLKMNVPLTGIKW